MTYRIVGWSTGGIGCLAIRSIARRADLDLVGLWVHSPDKVGADAGTLAGIDPLGVTATNDVEELIALRPDCVAYSASSERLDADAIPVLARLLAAGINVVTTSTPGLVNPARYHEEWRDELAQAAAQGGVTLYSSGIEPGFAADHLPLTLMTLSDTVHSVRTQEIFLYDSYPIHHVIFDAMGFGMPMEFEPMLASPGVQQLVWAPPVRMIADRLGVELDGIRETYEKAITPRTIEAASGTIEAGTVGAVHFETIGVVDGRDAIVIEHVNRMAADLCPEWPTAKNGTYRIVIEGSPDMTCDLVLEEKGNANDGGMVATAMRMVNAIPYVCDADAGLVSSLDLPLTTPRHTLV